MENSFDKEKIEKSALLLRTVAHPVRLMVVKLLSQKESMHVNEMLKYIQCEQSFLSHHLINMRASGVLSSTKTGQFVNYSLKRKDIVKILDCIENCGIKFD